MSLATSYRFEANTATNRKSLQRALQPQKERIKYDELMARREAVVKSELELNQKAFWSENLEEASEFCKAKNLASQLKMETKFANKALVEVRRAALRQKLQREYEGYEQELQAKGKAFYFKRE
jgi:DNA replication protein DnaD